MCEPGWLWRLEGCQCGGGVGQAGLRKEEEEEKQGPQREPSQWRDPRGWLCGRVVRASVVWHSRKASGFEWLLVQR